VVGVYGQTARSYALVSAVAVLATILFVRAMRSESWWAYSWYGLSLILLGNLHLFALLIVAAHGVALMRHRPHHRWRWPVAVLVAGYGVVPLAVFVSGQQAQIGWIVRPGFHTISRLVEAMIGPPVLVAVVAVVIGFALRRGTPSAVLAVAWLVLPPVILIAVSQVTPVFAVQYVVFCAPAIALLVGEGLAAMRILPCLLTAGLLLALVVPAQLQQRRENSREDLRAAASVLQRSARPGDAILFSTSLRRTAASAYPNAFAPLADVALVESPDVVGSYGGVEAGGRRLIARLARVRRVWLYVQSGAGHAAGAAHKDLAAKRHALEKAGFRLAGHWHPRSVELTLFTLRRSR
jgi:mannosyltransferase